MRILLTDDHAMVRRALRLILADHFKGAVFGEAGTAQEALSQVASGEWDVMVLDISLAGQSGFEGLRETDRKSVG